MKQVRKVAIVGAGAAGLCALRHFMSPLSASSTQFVATCFEQAPRVGGTWFYTDKIGKDEFGLPVHSSMYKNLKTNLPKECMAFPDFPFPKDLPSFMKHEDVQKYLEDYASHFDVLKYIQFQTIVKWVKPVHDEHALFKVKWEVTTDSVPSTSQEETHVFDAVLVCNGHYSVPVIPNVPGVESFKGEFLHSHDYREPADFAGKTVVLLGAASSGQDICLEVASVAKQVFLSHNKPPLPTPLPENVQQKPGIIGIGKDHVEFADGSIENVDAVMFCTGYYYDYSFLAPECGIRVEENRVTLLYKHFLCTKYPSLGIIGVCKTTVPFPMFDVQVRFFRSVLDGTCILKSKEEMDRDTDEDYKARLKEGLPHRYAHIMGERQFSYNNELSDLAKTSRLPKTYEQLYWLTHKMRRENLMEYKKANFSVDEEGNGYRVTE